MGDGVLYKQTFTTKMWLAAQARGHLLSQHLIPMSLLALWGRWAGTPWEVFQTHGCSLLSAKTPGLAHRPDVSTSFRHELKSQTKINLVN